MKKINLWIIFMLIVFFCTAKTDASFDRIQNTIFFKNLETSELRVFEKKSVDTIFELYFSRDLNKKMIGSNIGNSWQIISYCGSDGCFDKGTLKNGVWGIELMENGTGNIDNPIEKKYISMSDFSYSEKVSLLLTPFSIDILREIAIFGVLNVIIFQCFGYLLYKIFFRNRLKEKVLLLVYTLSFISYLVFLCIQYYIGFGGLIFLEKPFGFMDYMIIVGSIKGTIWIISLYTKGLLEKEINKKIYWDPYIVLLWLIIAFIIIRFLN